MQKIRTFDGSDFPFYNLTLLMMFHHFRFKQDISEPWFFDDQNLKDLLCLLKFLMISIS
jgi:hypothetical protein